MDIVFHEEPRTNRDQTLTLSTQGASYESISFIAESTPDGSEDSQMIFVVLQKTEALTLAHAIVTYFNNSKPD